MTAEIIQLDDYREDEWQEGIQCPVCALWECAVIDVTDNVMTLECCSCGATHKGDATQLTLK